MPIPLDQDQLATFLVRVRQAIGVRLAELRAYPGDNLHEEVHLAADRVLRSFGFSVPDGIWIRTHTVRANRIMKIHVFWHGTS